MNRILKYTLQGMCGALLVLCIACSFIAGSKAHGVLECKRLEVRILDSLENSFVSKSDIRTYLDKEYGKYLGCKADSLDLVRMEKVVDSRSAVMKSQAYMTKDGTLHIDVTQRKPVVRFQKKDGGFYADADGFIFPLQRNFASHVQVIDGKIPLAANSGYKGSISNPEEKKWFDGIMRLVNYMENDRTWKGKIVQIHIEENGELALIPREGNEIIIFGHPTDIEEKFRKLGKYYTVIIPEKGKDAYKRVDLRYRGQIVCK